jgi:uncharacterized protein (DUF2267 family)
MQVSDEKLVQIFKETVENLRVNGTACRILGVLNDKLQEHLPMDAAEKCNGKVFIGIRYATHLTPTEGHAALKRSLEQYLFGVWFLPLERPLYSLRQSVRLMPPPPACDLLLLRIAAGC